MRPEEELEVLRAEDANLRAELAAAQHLLTVLEHVFAGHPVLPSLDTG